MNEDTREYTLDDLEDIIREYSSRPRKEPKKPEPEGDTRRLGDTRPLERPAASDTRSFAAEKTRPLPNAGQDTAKIPTKAAPYTDRWEPEYDSPMGEYTPKEPIEFPKSRPQILKEKLEQSVQRQFQALDSRSLGQLRATMLLNIILFFAAAGMSFLAPRVESQRPGLMIVIQILLLFLSAMVGYKRLLEGVQTMLRRHFSMDSLLSVTLLVCLIDALVCLKSLRLPLTAVFSLQMLMAQWAHYQKIQIQISQLDTLRKATELTAVVKEKDYYKHQCAYREAEGYPEDFTNHYREESGPEKILRLYGLAVVAAGAVLALVTGLVRGAADGVRAYAAALLAAMPASAFICFCRPQYILEKRLHKLGTVLCGWSGIRNIDQQGYYPLMHEDLFPNNHVKLNGVRFYGERNPNTVVSYVSALMKADGGSLAVPFEQLRSSRNARVCKVEELTSYPGGVGGQIDGLSVIAGTLEFIENMGVELPEVSRIPHAVYAAVNQSLCAVFAVNFSRSKSSAAGLRTLCDSGHVKPILVDCDFAMTDQFLEQKLGVNTRHMQFPDCMTRMALAKKKPKADGPVIALTTRNGLAQRAFAVTGGSALGRAWRYGMFVHILGGGIGFLAVALLALCGAAMILTPYNLLLYGFLWMIPGLLLSEWTRAI